ncbi:MAG: recombination mediator RecR [Candidatus Nanopelagicales bacterium]
MYQGSLQDLIDALGKLPGIGPKSAQRLAFYFLQTDPMSVENLARLLLEVKQKVKSCKTCGAVSETETCNLCNDIRRDRTSICVVEEAKDISSVEKTREFKGKYHVLGGVISPIDGIGPDQLRIKELIKRVSEENIQEVIIATNPNLEGEATAAYLVKVLEPSQILVTRLASGLPVGGELEYADEVTLGRAFKGRRQVS